LLSDERCNIGRFGGDQRASCDLLPGERGNIGSLGGFERAWSMPDSDVNEFVVPAKSESRQRPIWYQPGQLDRQHRAVVFPPRAPDALDLQRSVAHRSPGKRVQLRE